MEQKISPINNFEAILKRLENSSKKKPKNQIRFDLNEAKKMIQAIGLSFDSDFIIDKENSEVYNKLCKYFNNFETDLNIEKGIMLQGNTGTGKTTVYNVFNKFNQEYKNSTPFMYNLGVEEIEHNIKANGSEWLLSLNKKYICINDIGDEKPELVLFGERCNLIEVLIPMRYDVWQRDGVKTNFTTNLNTKQMTDKYGARIAKRMYDMSNLLSLVGKNRRDKK